MNQELVMCSVVVAGFFGIYLTRPRPDQAITDDDKCKMLFTALKGVIRGSDPVVLGFYHIAIKDFLATYRGRISEDDWKYYSGELWAAWYNRRAELQIEEMKILNL